MSFLAIVPQLVSLFRLFLKLADHRRHTADRLEQRKIGRRQALLEALKDVQTLLSDAVQTREAFYHRIRDDPLQLYGDDGFKRPDPGSQTGSDAKRLND